MAPWVFNSISLLLALAVVWCYFSKKFNYLGTEFHLSPLSLKKKKKKKLNSEQYLSTSTIPNFCLFCKKKHTFSILHTHFYKTSILVYLFYHLFYLNNNSFLIFFYYIKQTNIHMSPPTFFFLCCEKKTDERATWRRERKKRIKKSFAHNNFVYLHIFTSTDVGVFFFF